jgi:superfamily II DNA helicase RecQ
MADPNPPPRLPDIIPCKVTQDSPFDGSNIDPLLVLPDSSFNDWAADDTAAAIAMLGCNDNHLKACTVAASASIWGVREMFPAQLNAVYRLLHPMRPNHLMDIQQMGAGKTHIQQTLGVIKRGIVLIFIPLLTLSADVMSKFTCTDQHFGAVTIQHLDKLYNANKQVYKDLLQRSQGLLCSITTTVFIFLFPQFIINHPNARDVFIKCSHHATLHVVTLDKAHIHVQHGTSFRSKIRALQA